MIELDGISGTTPIGFMAALGLLRVLGEDQGLPVTLSWNQAQPRLHGLGEREELVDALVTHMQGRHQDFEWNWTDNIKGVQGGEYLDACKEAWESGDYRALSFLAGWGTDAVITRDGRISYTRLNTTSARQKFPGSLRTLAKQLEDSNKASTAFRSALFGGPYDQISSFNWDPSTVRRHAHEAQAPTDTKPYGKSGWIWLAAESIAWHPVVPWSNRARTTGCERLQGQGMSYFWGLWSSNADLGPDEVRFLRSLDFQGLSRRTGIESLWASEFGKSGNFAMLLPAQRIHPLAMRSR